MKNFKNLQNITFVKNIIIIQIKPIKFFRNWKETEIKHKHWMKNKKWYIATTVSENYKLQY